MKKLLSMLLIAAMILGLMTTAFAAEIDPPAAESNAPGTYTIQIAADKDSGLTTNHEYTVYQIFTGDLAENDDGEIVLSNIKYGTAGIGKTGDAVPEDEITAITDAREYAQEIASKLKVAYGTLSATNNWTLNNVPAGYYLIVDETGKTLEEGDAYSSYIVQVVDDVAMAPKSKKVTSDKKTFDDDTQKKNISELGVGAVVPFELTATIADNADAFDTYDFVLVDKMSKGLTFNNDIKVIIGTVEATEVTKDASGKYVKNSDDTYTGDYMVYTEKTADGFTLKIALTKAGQNPGKTVVATYSATLNSDAKVMIPEKNEYRVVYSRNPEDDQTGKTHIPGEPIDENNDVYGKTPWTNTEHYSTAIYLVKEDTNGKKLAGAAFTLTSADANQTVLTSGEYYELDNVNGTYYLLKDGTYTTTAPTDTVYEKTGSKIDAGTDKNVGYVLVNGEYIVPQNINDYIGADLYIKKVGTASKYAGTDLYVKKTNSGNIASEPAPVHKVDYTDSNGELTFAGLGDGHYTLSESNAPDGFNYIDGDITFEIVFDPAEKTFTVDKVSAGADIRVEGGKFYITVVDKAGSVLPETGGMGTTLFYVFGAILVLGAGVLLITKKRMQND